ncbi:hypothetical protein T459_04315 [Capsicum annuum]|uniref:Uncharacterized protein n=1 Tax=Capsicum annuum TaxID=4072 RepID=A0A2G3A4P1_CAPAN|nr:hypothetical protein T459_04315 [Capsicum annuum]
MICGYNFAVLNNASANKYDLEGWFSALPTYRELVSCSNCKDYQSRKLEIWFGHKVGPKKAHEMSFLTRFYTISEAEKMGLMNTFLTIRATLKGGFNVNGEQNRGSTTFAKDCKDDLSRGSSKAL